MKNLNSKSKIEQLFIMMIICVGFIGVLCIGGCGGKSCEGIDCGCDTGDNYAVAGISIPGCGGCLSSGKGCNSCLWAQSCKTVGGCFEDDTVDSDVKFLGCDTRYYGDGCLGCAQNEKSWYVGFISDKEAEEKYTGCFYGSTDKEEKTFACGNGCVSCSNTYNEGKSTLNEIESQIGLRY